MKVYNLQKSIYFPGIFIVLVWFVISYLELAPLEIRSRIQQGRFFLLAAWLGVQLFMQRAVIVDAIRRPMPYLWHPQLYWLLYGMIALASAIYSVDRPSIREAANVAIFTLIVAVVTYLIANRPVEQRVVYAKRIWDLTLFMVGLRLLICLISAIMFFDLAFFEVDLGAVTLFRLRKQGFYGALPPNIVGHIGALLLVVSANRFCHTPKFRLYWFFVGCISVIALFLGYSRTAFVALGFIAIVYPVLQRKFFWLVGIILVLVMAMTQVEAVTTYLMRGQTASTFGALSNRLYIWEAAWLAIQEAPLTGYGYFSGERAAVQSFVQDYPNERLPRLSSNSFLSVLVGTGPLGFLPFAATLALIGWRLLVHFNVSRYHDGIYRMLTNELLAAFLIVLLTSLTLTNMIYVTTGIRNLSLLAIIVFASLPNLHDPSFADQHVRA